MQGQSQKVTDTKTDRLHHLRQSNIELLRIVAMLLIVAHHFAAHSGFNYPLQNITINRLWIQFIQIGGKIGVDLFVLISGYFLISQQTIKTSKVIKLWGQIIFYSVTIFLIFTVCGIEPFGIIGIIEHIAPVTFSQWWFVSTYFVLYLLFPYINRLLYTFDRKQYVLFLAVLLLFWSVIPSFTGQRFESNTLIWFFVLYAVAGYIKLFDFKTDLSCRKLFGISFAFLILTFLSAVIFDIIGTKIPSVGIHATFFYDMQRLPILIVSVLTFVGFTKLNIGYHKLINITASTTFGVYLIHDYRYMRPFIWNMIFNNAAYAESNLLIPHSLLVIAIVFIGCSIIELARIYLIENHMLTLIDKVSVLIDSKVKAPISNKILGIFK